MKNNFIARWLFTGCALIALMVIIGGITRLTQSGLSMVEWKPLTGILPPLSEQQWLTEFDKYKQSPEYIRLNYNYSLREFKSIFWWEFIHRLLGRIIGFVFIIPFFIFLFKRKLDKPLLFKLSGLFLLGALQGIIGWYMVKSGLVGNPHVSHYRLAIHLMMAVILFSATLWLGLDTQKGNVPLRNSKGDRSSKIAVGVLFSVVLIQLIYGAFVSG